MDFVQNSFIEKENIFLLEDCKKIVTNKLQTSDHFVKHFNLSPLEEKCGYFGDHFRVNIKVSYKNELCDLYFFAKFMPGPESGIDLDLSIGAFKKEIFIYEELFKKILESKIFLIENIVPKCYFSKSGSLLVFEDLKKVEFQTLPRYDYLNYSHVVTILRSLAKLHASSLIYEEKENVNLGELFSKYEETFYSEKDGHKGTKSLFAALKGLYTEIDIFNLPCLKMSNDDFKKKSEAACKKMLQLVKPSKVHRNVICHGDLWQTNFMMKCHHQIPVQCVILDFQTARYAPPAHDVMAFLYLTTSREFRKLHLEEVINLYYSELTKNVAAYGYNLQKIISYKDFCDSCEVQKLFGIVQSATYFQLTQVKSEFIAELAADCDRWEEALYEDHSILILENYKRDHDYKYRLEESLKDLKDFCENINLENI